MTYRLRLILGKWYIGVYSASGTYCPEHHAGPFDTIDQARDHGKSTGFRDGDK